MKKTAACLLCRRFSPLSAPQNATRSQNWLIGSTGPAGAAQLAPFAGTETLNRIAAETLEKEGIAALTPLLPFIDSRILEDFLNNRTH